MERIKNLLGLGKKDAEGKGEVMSDDPDLIISPDTLRANRIPAGQYQTEKWPVLHAGMVPKVNVATWRFRIFGAVEHEWGCSYEEFMNLPKVKVKSDFHCVTTWSLLDNIWEGVSTKEVLSKVAVKATAKFVLVHAEHGWTTNMPLEDFIEFDCLFAHHHNGNPLTPDHGYPLRLVVPRLYAWKSAKWVRGIELLEEDRAGFWEMGGYHMKGDPWKEQRYRWSD